MLSQRSLILSSFLFILFVILFLSSDFQHSAFQVIICSVSVILLLIPSTVFSISVIVLFIAVCSLVLLQFSHSAMSNSVTPRTAAHQASLSITNSWSLLKLMSIKSTIPSNRLILCHPLLFLFSIFSSIKVLDQVTKVLEFQLQHQSLMCVFRTAFLEGLIGLISLQSKGLSRVFSNTTAKEHQFFSAQLSLQSNSHIHAWLLENHSLD